MKTIPLTQGQVAIVDDEDYERLSQYKWHAQYSPFTKTFYACRSSKSGPKRMHRMILGAGSDCVIDHINHDTLDNRRVNIRIATRAQNNRNCRTVRGVSQLKGVSFKRGLWQARIQVSKKRYSLGYFENKEDAAIVYNVAAQLFFGEFAYINNI